MHDDSKLKVLSTTAMIGDIVKEVGGDKVDSLSLITGELDPHSYELVKGDDEKLARADLIFYNGLGLEHGPSLKEYLKGNSKAFGLGDAIRVENPDLILFDKGQVDPHIWMDISLWQKNVPYIVKQLQEKDPINASYYAQRGEELEKSMSEEDKGIYELLQAIPENERYLVTSHDAFNYFTRRYLAASDEKTFEEWKKRFHAPEGLAPEGQISVRDLQSIIDHMKHYGITVLFPESNVSKDSIKKILDAANQEGLNFVIAKDTLYGDAMGRAGTEGGTYLGMILSNAKVINKYLKKEKNDHS